MVQMWQYYLYRVVVHRGIDAVVSRESRRQLLSDDYREAATLMPAAAGLYSMLNSDGKPITVEAVIERNLTVSMEVGVSILQGNILPNPSH